MAEQTVTVGVGALSIEDVIAVARGGAKVAISDESKHEMALSRAVIDHLADDTVPHYGISTGFGALASTSIPKEQRAQLQKSLIRSHAAGAGPEVEREVVRGLLVLRLSTLCTGRTGVRPETAQVYADMLNAGITPVVYEYGSLGCSGDLAPLAACALVAMGEGEARNADGLKIGGGEALRAAGITPVDLKEKEGLALVNGTDGMLGMLCMAITDLRLLLKTADVAAAMSVEGMLGNDRVFAADLQALRPHRGQGDSAANIARMLKDSGLIEAGRPGSTVRVQDAYSLRCTPQVHGAARDTVEYAASVVGVELASAIDNPCVTLDGRVESNGNFHGAPLAYVLDFLAIPTADVASISERRTDRFLDVARNRGLPAFLAGDPGVDSGFMIAQYTAAGIVSEMKRNAVPPRSIRFQAPPCRKITCRWVGPPPASCAGRFRPLRACWPWNCCAPAAPSTSASRTVRVRRAPPYTAWCASTPTKSAPTYAIPGPPRRLRAWPRRFSPAKSSPPPNPPSAH